METATCDYRYPNLGESSSSSNPRKRKRSTNNNINNNNNNNNKVLCRKPDPSAPEITRPCTECGRKFWSWKALFGHMRCHPEREWRGIVPPPNIRSTSAHEDIIDDNDSDDHQVAAYLLMLANGPPPPPPEDGRFECSSCKKVFGSHQALGGHRASHKNVKGCYAITKIMSTDDDDLGDNNCCSEDHHYHSGGGGTVGRHKCSICFRVFSSGQALGGHMRCHWEEKVVLPDDEPSSSRPVFAFDLNLNLNLPPQYDDDDDACLACSPLELRLGL